MGVSFINESLIPLLCRKKGIPEADARGTITSHRARSTIATILRRSGASLEDIAEFLGHKDTKTVQAYARTDPFQWARVIKKANDVEREIQGWIDPRAAAEGKPSVFYFLGRGPDGKPRYCGNPFWIDCAHRLACQKCSMYIGGTEAELLEIRDWLIEFKANVTMTSLERAVVEGDQARIEEMLELKRAVPAPDPPSPEYIFNPSAYTGSLSSLPAPQRQVLEQKLVRLTRDLVAAEQAKGGRNVLIRGIKRQITAVTEQLAALEAASTVSPEAQEGDADLDRTDADETQ